jgi:hypothetical protein
VRRVRSGLSDHAQHRPPGEGIVTNASGSWCSRTWPRAQ